MEGASTKPVVFLLLIAASASVFAPFTAEARCKEHQRPHPSSPTPAPSGGVPPYQIHGCGYPCSDSNDCDWPCTICCANQTCCYDEPMSLPPSSPLPPPPPPAVQTPAPAPNGVGVPPAFPPYQIHGCGYPCSDSNDCDWPCTLCCYQNQTCCYEEPFP